MHYIAFTSGNMSERIERGWNGNKNDVCQQNVNNHLPEDHKCDT